MRSAPRDRSDIDASKLARREAALRWMATLVAHEASDEELYCALAEEVGRLLDVPLVETLRYEPDDTATVIGLWGNHEFDVGQNWPIDGTSVVGLVRQHGRPSRIDDYSQVPGTMAAVARAAGARSAVGAPIVLEDRTWGVVVAITDGDTVLPAATEDHLSEFTQLAATAVGVARARDERRQLADEQAALRRVATLVAEGRPAEDVFASVAREVSHVLGLPLTTVARIESGNVAIIVGAAGNHPHAAGARYVIEGPSASALVLETGQPARLDGAREIEGSVGGVRSVMTVAGTAAAPISVNGQTWGIVASGVPRGLELPIGVEQRLTQFTGLVATAISQATARSELLESRRRLVQAGDEERRRIVRDLHDGAQQRLVHTVMTLQRAQRTASPDEASALLAEALNHASAAIDELRDLAQGLHPAVLTHRGLAAALETLAERSPVPVALDVGDERYPSSVEAAAYFVAAEGLTNVAKYAKATSARVCAQVCDRDLVLTVADDGVGNATVADGHGLGGLRDRMTAIGGRLTIHSPAGEGTTIRADIPIP